MIFLDYFGIGLGVLAFVVRMLKTAENEPKLSFFQIIEGNIREGRGLKIVWALSGCFGAYYFFSYMSFRLLLISDIVLNLNNASGHLPIPFLVALMPSLIYNFIASKIAVLLVKSEEFGRPTKILQFINESTIKFWASSVEYSKLFYAAKIIDDKEKAAIVKILFEKKKIVVALEIKSIAPLIARDIGKITHLMMDIFGYEHLNNFINNKVLKHSLLCDFINGGKGWDGTDQRKKSKGSRRRRIGDFTHIQSTVCEGLKKLY